MIERAQIIEAARGFIGCPWRHQGRQRAGMDCVGLLILVARECGLRPRDQFGYSRLARGNSLKDALAARCKKGGAVPGDIVLMRDAGTPQHVGILTDLGGDRLGLVHAMAETVGLGISGKVLEMPFAGSWRRNAIAYFEFPDVVK